ncbi:MAG TPA: discoidin domain-containing protein, partial [Pseudonocardiaceae bacterium]|nr:discoidin domain-containing protein [Pseudonocardiaceae bacterium]
SSPAGPSAGRAGSFVLSATNTGPGYAPTFTGNGYLGVRVPPAGQGYAGGSVPAQSELAGFYAQPAGQVQQRANIPTWSTLTFTDGGKDFDLATGTVSGWRQQLDLHTGEITTTARWTAPDGHVTDLRYDVFTDRARRQLGVVRLDLTPHWSGPATVTDLIDGTPADLTTGVAQGRTGWRDWETVRTVGTGLDATLASELRFSGDVSPSGPAPVSGDQTVGQRATFPVSAGRTYTVTKYVGVAGPGDPNALGQASGAAARGFSALRAENRSAWARLWADRIDVLGNPALATEVNASEFYLWSSTRAGVDWSVSPAGLSSNGYSGHIFWDAETWMFPYLLALHPELAAGMNDYRFDRLGAAEAHAAQTGFQGARFPWESALDGTEQIPPPVSVNSEGLFEQHITADVALAQWQYYLATGDRSWLTSRGWPVLSRTAAFWAGRAKQDSAGRYHISDVTGPDEENPDVDDEAYTNVAAAATLRIATEAAHVVGVTPPAGWQRIAAGLAPPFDPAADRHPEFAGYQGQMVKQADVTMLQYPWAYPMAASTATNDLNYYVPRSDPGGPSMSDAINSIDTAALGTPGCATYTYTQRSIEPFIRDAFDQFSETRTGGAFTFMTGIGGFLQEFLYGYSGLRWNADSVALAPSLTSQLRGVVLHGLAWHGSRFTVAVGPATTRVTVDSGPALPVRLGNRTHTVAPGATLSIPTGRPDRTPTTDLVRCQAASASSAQPGEDALSAVDGSPATGWQPTAVKATLTVPVTGSPVSSAVLTWGQRFPGPPGPNIPPPPGPVTTLRATDYDVAVSSNGHTWTTVAQVHGRTTGTTDTLSFPPTAARFVRVTITGATASTPPILTELTVRK